MQRVSDLSNQSSISDNASDDPLAITKLGHPPLIEAIAELRWELEPLGPPELFCDPHYKLLPGKMATALQEDYPYIDELSTVGMPEEIAAYIVQYQFRVKEKAWPLVQLGPGIITLNQMGKDYQWDDFERRIDKTFSTLRSVHPKVGGLKLNRLLLRYIDAFPFDFLSENILTYLRNNLKTTIELDETALAGVGISGVPSGMDVRLSYQLTEQKSSLHIRFTTGTMNGELMLIMETVVQQDGDNVNQDPIEILNWFKEAHTMTHRWFFTLTEGPLLEGLL